MGGMPHVPEPRRDLERIGIRRDRLRRRMLGNRCDRQPQLAVAMIELPNEDLFFVRQDDTADNLVPLSDDP
jgi:hypothetical protein